MKQTIDRNRYRVIPRTLIFVFIGEKCLFIKKSEPAAKWNGLGGHIESGEDILSAAGRELEEESGIKDVALVLAGNIMIDVSPDTGISLFLLKGEAQSERVVSSSEGELSWFFLDEIGQQPVFEDIPVLVGMLSKWQPGDEQIVAHYSLSGERNFRNPR